MNSVDFGKLIAALRKEHDDEEGNTWTQEELARQANAAAGGDMFTREVITRIEGGKRRLDGRALLALATALQLTSGERREFFLAATGIDVQEIVRRESDPQEVLSQFLDKMERVYSPAHIVDSYGDILAINSAFFEVLGFQSSGLGFDSQEGSAFPFNEIRVTFSDEGARHFMKLMGDDWPNFAHMMVAFFRTITLRYRSAEYFQELLRELRSSRHFRRYWKEVYFDEKDRFVTTGDELHFDSPKWGRLAMQSTLSTAVTAAGELHLTVWAPLSAHTARVFWQLMEQAGPPVVFRLDYSWPKKVLPR